MSKTKFAIGCLVQWYEVDIIGEYIETLKEAIDKYNGEIIIDFCVVENEKLEKCSSLANKIYSIEKIKTLIHSEFPKYFNDPDLNVNFTKDLITIADYRREFNNKYCEQVDVLIWGESDMLVPKQMFISLDVLHQNVKYQTPKYLATFGICKMWDDSWKPLEHVDFTNKKIDPFSWWGTRYTMTKEEMNRFNNKVEDLDVRTIQPHKFNGCGLVTSSEVVKSGVNIPQSVFFTHEDTAFMLMTQKILGNIPQYHFANILLVHKREHPEKRKYVANEGGRDLGARRKSNNWYPISSEMSKQNAYNLFNLNYKSYTWEDVWKTIE